MVDGVPAGELISFANGLEPGMVDVVFGDHTDVQFSGTINGVLVHENRSFGGSYAQTLLTVQPGRERGRTQYQQVGQLRVAAASDGGPPGGNTACPAAPTSATRRSSTCSCPIASSSQRCWTGTSARRRAPSCAAEHRAAPGDAAPRPHCRRHALALQNPAGVHEQRRPSASRCGPPLLTGEFGAQGPCGGYAAGPRTTSFSATFSVLPFGNILTTRTVTGAQIWAPWRTASAEIGADGELVPTAVPADLRASSSRSVRHRDAAPRATAVDS